VICPWTTPLAFATEAVRAGVRLMLGTRVTGAQAGRDGHLLSTTRGTLRARWVVNAAGLHSDRVDAHPGAERPVPGVLLRRYGVRADGRAARGRPGPGRRAAGHGGPPGVNADVLILRAYTLLRGGRVPVTSCTVGSTADSSSVPSA
jgi:glycine/D-amino acid oxidase-like deaminating enzyme